MKTIDILINPVGQLTIAANGFEGGGLRKGDGLSRTGAGGTGAAPAQTGVSPSGATAKTGRRMTTLHVFLPDGTLKGLYTEAFDPTRSVYWK